MGQFGGGYVQIRRGLVDHVNDGDMTFPEYAAFTTMLILARAESGVWCGSAEWMKRIIGGLSKKTMERAFAGLEDKGYILRDLALNGKGKTGGKILISKYLISRGVSRGLMVDLEATKRAFGIPEGHLSLVARKLLRAAIARACSNPLLIEENEDDSQVSLKGRSDVSQASPDCLPSVAQVGYVTKHGDMETRNRETKTTRNRETKTTADVVVPAVEEPSPTNPQKGEPVLPIPTQVTCDHHGKQTAVSTGASAPKKSTPAEKPTTRSSVVTRNTKPAAAAAIVYASTNAAAALQLAEYLETLRDNPGSDLQRDAVYLAPLLATTDLETAKKILALVKADSNAYWWKEILKSSVSTVVRKFADFKVAYNAMKPKAAKLSAADGVESSYTAGKRIRDRAVRYTDDAEKAIAAGAADALELAEKAKAKADQAYAYVVQAVAEFPAFKNTQALEAITVVLAKATAAVAAASAAKAA